MSRAGARRAVPVTSRESGGRLGLLVLVVLVALTVGGLALAGRTARPTAVRHPGQTTATPAQRQLVCPSSTSDTSTYIGLLPGTPGGGSVNAAGKALDLAAGRVVTVGPPGRKPLTVTALGPSTRGVFGSRVTTAGGMTRCGSPRASWWFVGAGASPAHPSTLELVNPRPGPAVVDVTVWGPDGPIQGAGLRGISVPSGGAKRVRLADAAPSGGILALHAEASRGLVLAAVDDRVVNVVDRKAAPVSEWIPDQTNPTEHQVLSGLPAGGSPVAAGTANPALPPALRQGPALVLANPGSDATIARVRLSGKNGTFSPKGLAPTTVPAESVVSVPLGAALQAAPDSGATSLVVDSDAPVAAGYVMAGSKDLLHAVSAASWRGPAAVALPGDGTSTLLLTAPAGAETVAVTQLGPRGIQLAQSRVAVPGRSSVGTTLRQDAASVVVTSTGGVVGSVRVARRGTDAALPLTPVLAALRVPEVRPAG